jgi:hypothetical protein
MISHASINILGANGLSPRFYELADPSFIGCRAVARARVLLRCTDERPARSHDHPHYEILMGSLAIGRHPTIETRW